MYYSASDATATELTSPTTVRPVGGAVKRVIDVSITLMALPFIAMACLLVALIMRFTSPGPVLFRHRRIGFQGQAFDCLKFRTMVIDADAALAAHLEANPEARAEFERDRKLRNDPRIVPGIGHLLRKTSLDELPQFFNVLRGEMSIVGPRPVTEDEVEMYGRYKPAYLSVRPGITGLWQVSGRNSLTFAERVSIDARYVRGWSLRLDANIFLRTFAVFTDRNGAY